MNSRQTTWFKGREGIPSVCIIIRLTIIISPIIAAPTTPGPTTPPPFARSITKGVNPSPNWGSGPSTTTLPQITILPPFLILVNYFKTIIFFVGGFKTIIFFVGGFLITKKNKIV
jgi:hypothetical protein